MIRALTTVLGAALIACSASHAVDDAGADATDSGAPILDALLAFEREYARARCEYAVRCAPDEARHSDGPGFHDCWSHAIDQAEAAGAYRAGRVVFDPALAAECLRGWRARICGPFLGPDNQFSFDRDLPYWEPRACEGAVQYRQACGAGVTCDGDTACVGDTCAACVPWAGAGESCTAARCGLGSHCEGGVCVASCLRTEDCGAGGTRELTCRASECVRTRLLPHLGEPCELLDPSPSENCAEGSCDTVDHVCVRLGDLGEPCAGRSCERGLDCDAATSTCVVAPAGGQCPDIPATFGCSRATPYCVDGSCVEEPPHAFCQASWPSSMGCADAYTCVVGEPRDGGHCVPQVPVGAACDETVICASGAVCRDGHCVSRVPPWEPCGADAICPTPYTCVDLVCVAPPTLPGPLDLFAPCASTRECGVGQCLGGRCTPAPDGGACEFDGQRRECAHWCTRDTCAVLYPLVGEGESCDGRACADGLWCAWSPERGYDACLAECR